MIHTRNFYENLVSADSKQTFNNQSSKSEHAARARFAVNVDLPSLSYSLSSWYLDKSLRYSSAGSIAFLTSFWTSAVSRHLNELSDGCLIGWRWMLYSSLFEDAHIRSLLEPSLVLPDVHVLPVLAEDHVQGQVGHVVLFLLEIASRGDVQTASFRCGVDLFGSKPAGF